VADPWIDLGDLLQDHLERYIEAEIAYREAIYRNSKDAWAWLSLGNLLQDHLKRYDEAEVAYREAIARDPKEGAPWHSLGNLLQYRLQRYIEAEAAYREALAHEPRRAEPWNELGNLYCDQFDRLSDAAEAFETGLRLDPTDVIIHQNRLFLRRDFLGEGTHARPLMGELLAFLEHEHPDTTQLHEALFAAYDSNWGLARDNLGKALTIRTDGFGPYNTDDWLRASAVLLHLNYGAELLAFLDQRGDTARLRPWVEALRAHQLGDRRVLQNIAPEIRTAAEIFYDGIESRLKKLPEKTRRRPLPTVKKTRTRRTGGKARR
jgi:tetratricopeptide (TPR) repeat protein